MEEEKKGMKWCVTYAAKLDAFVGCTIFKSIEKTLCRFLIHNFLGV